LAFDGVVDNADCSCIVNVNGNWWLWVAKFFKDNSQDLGFLCIKEESTQFSFSGRCSNQLENRACDVDGTVDDNWRIIMGMLPRKKYPPARLCALGALR